VLDEKYTSCESAKYTYAANKSELGAASLTLTEGLSNREVRQAPAQIGRCSETLSESLD
jgi:hypothetical protein